MSTAKRHGHRLSLATLQAVEQGKRNNLQAGTKQALASGLDWPLRHVDELLHGVVTPEPPPREDIRRVIAEELRALSRQPEERGFADIIRELDAGAINQVERAIEAFLDMLRAERSRRADEA